MFSYQINADTQLRLIEDRHARELFDLTDRNRRYLRQWLPWLDSTITVEDTRQFIKDALQQFAANEGFQAGIWYRGTLAGVVGYHKIDWFNRQVEIGYWLGADYQGKGLMTESCRALVDHAFHQLRLNRVQIRCAVGNTRSCAIPERLGFTREGMLAQGEWLYDHYIDLIMYGMLASEWKRNK
jgi:ribosomal-protein-serine acetyltransferase